jgi:hypothetical protein
MPVFSRPNSLAIVDKPLDLGGGQGERELMLVSKYLMTMPVAEIEGPMPSWLACHSSVVFIYQ